MKNAAQMDNYQQRANRLFSKANKVGSSKKKWTPKLGKPNYVPERDDSYKHDLGVPMDIDRLEPREQERRKKNNLCFHCGKPWSPGHFKECHNRPKPSGPPPQRQKEFQGSKFQGKKPQEKKKFSPSEACAHIRAIIANNFEEGSAEYEEFVNEVETQGF